VSAVDRAAFRDLRRLNTPMPIAVRADARGEPLAVRRRSWARPRPVARVQDRWRIDDEWWRPQPIARLYYLVTFEDGTPLTIYQDLVTGDWFEQRGT
jgi:hypothetical protein